MLHITQDCWQMMMLAARHNKGLEVAGFARATFDEHSNSFVVSDILIPPQEIGGTHADIESDDLDWLLATIVQRGDKPADWNLWWHSHVKMSTSPSGTDHNTLATLAKQSARNFALGLVVNVDEQATAWVTFKSPVTGVYLEEKLDVEVEQPPINPELVAAVEAMMEQVEEKKWSAPVTQYQQGKGMIGQSKGSGVKTPLDELMSKDYSPEEQKLAWDKYLQLGMSGLTDREFAASQQYMDENHESAVSELLAGAYDG